MNFMFSWQEQYLTRSQSAVYILLWPELHCNILAHPHGVYEEAGIKVFDNASGRCKSTQTLPVPSVWETTYFHLHWTRSIILFMKTTLILLGFGEMAIDSTSETMKQRTSWFTYQSNPVGVELFSYFNTYVGSMLHILPTEIKASEIKLHISSFDLFGRKQRSFNWSKSRGYKTRSQTTAFSYTFCVDMSAWFLNANNANLKH